MTFRRVLALAGCLCTLPIAAGEAPRTMRVDYLHSGTATTEELALERVVIEPLPWPGNPRQPLDDTNLGPYRFEVVDRATQRVLFSRGFASIFGEWQSTAEARTLRRALPESVRFPTPLAPVRVRVLKRTAANDFLEIAGFAIDPADPAIDRAVAAASGASAEILTIQESGDPADKVDLLLLGDGYTAAERVKFESDARRLIEVLFRHSPFKEHRADFNVWGVVPAASESGVRRPSTGHFVDSPVGSTYDAFGSERYLLTFDDRAFRELASLAPYDFVEILVNSETYGGGGIYQLYGTVATGSAWAEYVFVHELGHHFAALADEYYTSPVAYQPAASGDARPEPWERNVTADPTAAKWRDLITPGTATPTPWRKAEFEALQRDIQDRRRAIRAARRPESEMDALFREEREKTTRLLGADTHAHAVGAFEGASYEAQGLYRSQEDCVMFTRDEVDFCAVCRRAIEEVIALYFAPAAPPSTDVYEATLSRTGDRWTVGAPKNLTDRPGYDNQPAYSPDGGKLYWTSFRDGQTDLVEYDRGRGASRFVTATPESEYSPTPAPDGVSLTAVRVEGDGTQRLWRFPLGQGEASLPAPHVPGVGYHAWLGPRTLAFFVLGDPVTLELVELPGGAPRRIAEGIGRSLHRIPGTAHLSYVAGEGEAREIRTFDPATGRSERLAPAPASENRDYAWTPDGTLVAAVGARLMRFASGQWLPFADLTEAGITNITRIAVSPGGDRIAFVVDR
jgi:hypothetical protein